MQNLTSDPKSKLLFQKLDSDLQKHLLASKPDATCRFCLDQIVDLNDLQNLDLQLKSDAVFQLQIRANYLLQVTQKENNKPSKLHSGDLILSGVQINPTLKFQIKRQYQTELEPLPKPIGILIWTNQTKQPFQLIVQNSEEKIQMFGKMLQSKFAVQKNFHKIFMPLKKLGKGSSATVIQGKDLRDEQNYAIKGFKKSKGFSLEKLNSVFETQNSLYMVYDRYDENLYDFLINQGLNSEYELKAIIKGLLQALQFLHSKGIMHRDIKPQNIMIKREQFQKKEFLKRKTNIVPVLIDFGFAENQQNQEFTVYRCGTPGFIAPQILKDYMIEEGAVDSFNSEVSASKKKYGKACDLFSLGCLFHILLTNKMLFSGQTRRQLIQSNMQAIINPSTKDYKLMDISAKKLLFRMLQKDPLKRVTASQALKDDFFKLQMFNFKPIKFRNPLSLSNQLDKDFQQEDEDRDLLLFQ